MAEASLARPHQAFLEAKVFKGLSPKAISSIAQKFSPRTIERDEFLFHESEPAHTYYLIGEGQVKILQTSSEGFDVILHVLGLGDLIGALPTLGEGTYPASAQGLSDVRAFAIPATEFEGILQRHSIVAINLLRFAAGVIQHSHKRLREMATERVERRLARVLSRLSNQLGRKTRDEILIDAPLTRQDLAEMTGTSPFTVSRTLKMWERQGILRSKREQVIISDQQALASIGDDLSLQDEADQD